MDGRTGRNPIHSLFFPGAGGLGAEVLGTLSGRAGNPRTHLRDRVTRGRRTGYWDPGRADVIKGISRKMRIKSQISVSTEGYYRKRCRVT